MISAFVADRLDAMDGPYYTGPPPWNPSTEAWPGGPHPGAIVAAEEQRRAEETRHASEAEQAEAEARQRLVNHLLLQR
jgi:hypothetical protein